MTSQGENNTNLAQRIGYLLSTAEKYKVEGVKPFVLHLLEKRWPPTLVGWLGLQGELSRRSNDENGDTSLWAILMFCSLFL